MPSEPVSCDLCGLPIRGGTRDGVSDDWEFRFCCIGCRQVFTILTESAAHQTPSDFKNTDLFKRCRDLGIIPSPEAPPGPPPLASPGHPCTNDVNEILAGEGLLLHLAIDRMWCPACAWIIEESLKKQPGVAAAECNFSTDRLRIRYDPVQISPDRIGGVIQELGYASRQPGEEVVTGAAKREFIRFAVSTFLTVNVMMLSFAVYSGFFQDLPRDAVAKLSWPTFFMATGVLVYGGWNIFRKALAGLRAGVFGMETLISAGAISAYGYSLVGLLSGSIHLYFDTAAMLITLVLLGKSIERRAKEQVQKDLGSFFALVPQKVRIVTDASPRGSYVSADGLAVGDRFRVVEGEVVPADGRILSGAGEVNEASLTGEAIPVVRRSGQRLRSGASVSKGEFIVRAEAVGANSTLGQMIRIIEMAMGGKSPLEGKTDRVLRYLVPLILALAMGTWAVCLLAGLPANEAMIRAVTVMVISCPCALGIAIPLARVAGISIAGKRGILVRDFSAFERAVSVDTVVFDKTGTLTRGQWVLRRIIPLGDFDEEQILAVAAALEEFSDHVIAREIKHQAGLRGLSPEPVQQIEIDPGGISGRLHGEPVRIGSREFVGRGRRENRSPWQGAISTVDSSLSMVYMTFGDRPGAVMAFGDALKERASETVAGLGRRGLRIVMVSGDGQQTSDAVARAIGIGECYGEQMPADKALRIRTLQESGSRVAMVGDGINDAPALVQSNLGVAVHSDGNLGHETADLTIIRGDPAQVEEFLTLAEMVNRKIQQNLVFTFLYNAISIPVAMGGLLSPLVAVSAMLLSSLSVIGNTLLLIRSG